MEDLAEVAEDLVTYLGFYVGNAEHAPDALSRAAAGDMVTTYFQGVAICELLLDAEVEQFLHKLIRSGRARRWVLRNAGGEDRAAKILRASNTRGFLGALAGGDWTLARELAHLEPSKPDPRVEYPEDFAYAKFLHAWVDGGKTAAAESSLRAIESALDGNSTTRLALCQALWNRDFAALRGAFDLLIEDRRKEMDKLRKTSLIATDPVFVPFSSIYVEGLAWLRVMSEAGLDIEEEIPFCPLMARARPQAMPNPGFPE